MSVAERTNTQCETVEEGKGYSISGCEYKTWNSGRPTVTIWWMVCQMLISLHIQVLSKVDRINPKISQICDSLERMGNKEKQMIVY